MLAEYVPYLRSLWTVWFFAVFIGLVISALLPKRRAQYDHTARIPLNDDPAEGAARHGR
ncbi:MAG: cbb3-type cytochrome oxidase subunit 3 [Reyranellaceae bacterium]